MVMIGLDLFSGIGGITIGLSRYVIPVAYCESNKYCQAVLMSRMSEGQIPIAPIWDDVSTLRGSKLHASIDIMYGGFPCQDISVAARTREGMEGKRSGLFFEILRLAKEIKPTFIFLENVPAITRNGINVVGQSLAEIGYDCRWDVVSAKEVGAPHQRERWFLLAHNISERRKTRRTESHSWERDTVTPCCSIQVHKREWEPEPDVGGTFDGLSSWLDGSGGLGDAEAEETGANKVLRYLRQGNVAKIIWQETRRYECFLAEETLLAFVREYEKRNWRAWNELEGENSLVEFLRTLWRERPPGCSPHGRGQAEQYFREYPDAMRVLSLMVASRGSSQWGSPLWESSTPRTVMKLPNRADRVEALGNAVVPAQVSEAFERLIGFKKG